MYIELWQMRDNPSHALDEEVAALAATQTSHSAQIAALGAQSSHAELTIAVGSEALGTIAPGTQSLALLPASLTNSPALSELAQETTSLWAATNSAQTTANNAFAATHPKVSIVAASAALGSISPDSQELVLNPATPANSPELASARSDSSLAITLANTAQQSANAAIAASHPNAFLSANSTGLGTVDLNSQEITLFPASLANSPALLTVSNVANAAAALQHPPLSLSPGSIGTLNATTQQLDIPASPATTNTLEVVGNQLASTVNGVASYATLPTTTNTLTVTGAVISSNVNGVVSNSSLGYTTYVGTRLGTVASVTLDNFIVRFNGVPPVPLIEIATVAGTETIASHNVTIGGTVGTFTNTADTAKVVTTTFSSFGSAAAITSPQTKRYTFTPVSLTDTRAYKLEITHYLNPTKVAMKLSRI